MTWTIQGVPDIFRLGARLRANRIESKKLQDKGPRTSKDQEESVAIILTISSPSRIPSLLTNSIARFRSGMNIESETKMKRSCFLKILGSEPIIRPHPSGNRRAFRNFPQFPKMIHMHTEWIWFYQRVYFLLTRSKHSIRNGPQADFNKYQIVIPETLNALRTRG